MTGMARLQLIGGGKMGEALLVGLIANGWAEPDELHVVEPDAARQGAVASAAPGVSVSSGPVGGTDAVIAVKPDVVAAVLPALAASGTPRVLSIAAGIRTDAIEGGLPAGTPVVRAMPNTPALVGKGAAAIAPGSASSPEDLDWARGILEAVGTVAVVSETDLDAVTGLSGQRSRLPVPAGRGPASRGDSPGPRLRSRRCAHPPDPAGGRDSAGRVRRGTRGACARMSPPPAAPLRRASPCSTTPISWA